MANSKWIWALTTYPPSKYLDVALATIPEDEDYIIYDVKELDMSLAAVWNKAIMENVVDGPYETVIICNDDIELVRPDTGNVMHTALHKLASQRDGVMVNAYNTKVYGNRGLMFVSGLLKVLPEFYDKPGILPEFSCFAVGQDLIDNVGWFDEAFDPCFFEDIDMVRRITLLGRVLYVVCPIFHHREGSWDSHKDRRSEALEKSQQYYIQKWGGDMLEETYNVPFGDHEAKVIIPV